MIAAGCMKHRREHIIAASQSEGGGTKECRAEGVELVLVFVFRCWFVFDDTPAETLVDREHWKQQKGASKIENRVGVRDDARRDDTVP